MQLVVKMLVSFRLFLFFTVFVNFRVLSLFLFLGATVGPACCAAAWVDVEV